MAKWVFLNEGFLEEENASLHFRDLSFQRGYGIFDFFRLMENRPLFLVDHLHRFFSSASEMHLAIPFSPTQLKSAIIELIQKNNLPGTGIRLSLTGGYSEDGFNLAKPNLVISQHPFTPPTAEQRKTGIRLVSYPHQRQLPHVKTIDYLMAIWLQPFRKENGADDILYHQGGKITECPRSNFFLVTREEKLLTPAKNVLKGITAKKLLHLAKEHFAVEEGPVTLEDIKSAKEAFITSTTKQVLPISSINDHVLKSTAISNRLQELFSQAYMV